MWTKKTTENKRLATTPPPAPATPSPTEALATVQPQPLSAEQIEDLKAKAAKADEHWDRLLRTTADFENFKKRAARERQEAVKFANEGLIQKLIPVVDSFDVAAAAVQDSQDEVVKSLQAGVAMIHQQLRATLENAGLEEVDATGKPFDPTIHEAVAQHETSEVAEGHVSQQIRKGYKLRGRLLRPASVVVAKAPAPAPVPARTENKAEQ